MGKDAAWPHPPTPGHLRARLPGPGEGPGAAGRGLGSEHPPPRFGKPRCVRPGCAGPLVLGDNRSLLWGVVCPGKEQSLAMSSISLWQKKSLYIVFKGGFCLRNLSEHARGVMLGRGCWNGSPSHPGLDLQRPPQLQSKLEPQEGVPAASAAPLAPPGATLYHPLWV